MRMLMTLFFLLGLGMTLNAADTFVYVSLAPEQKIHVYRFNEGDGTLTLVEAVALEGSPGCLTVDADKRHLFASVRTTSSLASFRIDPATGKLTPLSTAALPKGENAAFIGTDRSGKYLLSASYAAGKVVVHPLQDGKIVTPPTQTLTTEKTAHCIASDREGNFIFVPHVAPNAVFQYRLDAAGKLQDAGKAPGGKENAGPRHLAFHPTLPMAFTSDEVANTITAYRFDASKGLQPVQNLPTLPADFKEKNTTAEVKVHPNGKFVWVSNRGHESLAGFAIDPTGKLTSLSQTPTEKTPRSFEFDPSGKYLFGAGEGSGKLAVFRVDTETGKLTRQHTIDIGKSLTWVMAVRLGN